MQERESDELGVRSDEFVNVKSDELRASSEEFMNIRLEIRSEN
ncbi:hypothetical protein HMPREF3034_02419 [Prevotella sp. DNF00663]|nr:hypothetical protein HMPREF3034_02419 [Prevotella sp. DNF00663]